MYIRTFSYGIILALLVIAMPGQQMAFHSEATPQAQMFLSNSEITHAIAQSQVRQRQIGLVLRDIQTGYGWTSPSYRTTISPATR